MEDLAFQLVAAIDLGGLFTKILNVLSVALGLGLVIFFHELGHFAVAKWCNVHVERFSIGIGPILWSRQKGETEYALSALPFGGYKSSGYGREKGFEALYGFTTVKTVAIKHG